jgi:hypothetical protein
MQANLKGYYDTGSTTLFTTPQKPCKPPAEAGQYYYHWLRNVVHNNLPVMAMWNGDEWKLTGVTGLRSPDSAAQMGYVWYGLVEVPRTPRVASKRTRTMMQTNTDKIRTVKRIKKKD